MNLKRCESGHFYDADKFADCPHCSGAKGDGNVTVGIGNVQSEMVTVPSDHIQSTSETPKQSPSIRSDIEKIMTVSSEVEEDDNEKTIGIYVTNKGTEPVVGWLVCIKGEYYGECFKLKAGRNFIGRSGSMDVKLGNDHSVSRDKHAIILYEPKRREFMAQAGESRELFYRNDEVVLTAEKLKSRDMLIIGNTKLMFIPCCGPDFSWDDYKNE